jgi:multidrug efflux pump subunit AcrA (membrane-fusion protein)
VRAAAQVSDDREAAADLWEAAWLEGARDLELAQALLEQAQARWPEGPLPGLLRWAGLVGSPPEGLAGVSARVALAGRLRAPEAQARLLAEAADVVGGFFGWTETA